MTPGMEKNLFLMEAIGINPNLVETEILKIWETNFITLQNIERHGEWREMSLPGY
jgi:hypothetical protein